MNQILSIFLPAVFAMYIYQKINKKEINNREYIVTYFVFVLLINIISYIVSIYIFKKPEFIFTNVFTVKYLGLSSVLGVVISFITSFIEQNLEVNIRVDRK